MPENWHVLSIDVWKCLKMSIRQAHFPIKFSTMARCQWTMFGGLLLTREASLSIVSFRHYTSMSTVSDYVSEIAERVWVWEKQVPRSCRFGVFMAFRHRFRVLKHNKKKDNRNKNYILRYLDDNCLSWCNFVWIGIMVDNIIPLSVLKPTMSWFRSDFDQKMNPVYTCHNDIDIFQTISEQVQSVTF
jgi:hypothetical protein